MSDPLPPPVPPKDKPPLEYWHSTDPAPLHPILLAMYTVAGMIVGAVAATLVGGFVVGAVFAVGPTSRETASTVAITFLFLGAIAYGTMLMSRIRRDRALTFDHRRRGGRLFQIGLLLGCGLACLLGGLCFSAMR